MNTKSLPAVLALIAGFATCIMSFVQHVDTVVFAKRFIIICIIFFAIGTVISVIIQMNFKDMSDDKTESEENENSEEDSEAKEDTDKAEETETAGEQ
jgi:hypothetical protein